MNRQTKRMILGLFDIAVITAAGSFSYFFLDPYLSLSLQLVLISQLLIVGVYSVTAFYLRLFDKINRYTSIRETVVHSLVVIMAFLKRLGVLMNRWFPIATIIMKTAYFFLATSNCCSTAQLIVNGSQQKKSDIVRVLQALLSWSDKTETSCNYYNAENSQP